MKNPYDVLGVKPGDSPEDIKKAYRKLAQQHHPDRHADADKAKAESKFKEVQSAYEEISSGKANRSAFADFGQSSPFNSSIDEILRAFNSANNYHRSQTAECRIFSTLKEAFTGKHHIINVGPNKVNYYLQPGMPPGVSITDRVQVGSDFVNVRIKVDIVDQHFAFRQVGSIDGNHFCGDLVFKQDISVIDLIIGTWITVRDFMGEELKVRVPAGFNPMSQQLKVAGKGYTNLNWNNKSLSVRGDLYLQLNPIFTSLQNAKKDKIKELSAAIEQLNA